MISRYRSLDESDDSLSVWAAMSDGGISVNTLLLDAGLYVGGGGSWTSGCGGRTFSENAPLMLPGGA